MLCTRCHAEGQLVVPVVRVNTDDRLAMLVVQQGVLDPFVVSCVFRQINDQQRGLVHALLLPVQFFDIRRILHVVPDPHAAKIQVFKQRKHSFPVFFRETEI